MEQNQFLPPLGAHFKLASIIEEDEAAETGEFPYANAIGSIMYAMTGTRPDLAYAIGVVSRFMSNPGRVHWATVQWILKYLKGTHDNCLVFKKNSDFKRLLGIQIHTLLVIWIEECQLLDMFSQQVEIQ